MTETKPNPDCPVCKGLGAHIDEEFPSPIPFLIKCRTCFPDHVPTWEKNDEESK